ncbi:MAG: N,N-dimethylformamidase beta subunit family domain-containing protein [Phyllobacterium sp.]|uniref:N,N-dimethylformamidase beta subunit family domain-containing protein n=1 Tax=Phyllobacterium sp. TaxID=1871046 RepID=UPI0030F22F35
MHARDDFPDFGLTESERREAVLGHYYEYPGMDGDKGEIWCYTDALSYAPGAQVTLFVSSTSAGFDAEIIRDGALSRVVFQARNIGTCWQETPDQCSVVGCGWEAQFDFTIGADWPSGAYRVRLTAEGRKGALIGCDHIFIVRPRTGKKAGRVLQVTATGTWAAYNTWGGSNHYQGITGPQRNQFAPIVSMERPLGRGFVRLPATAPRIPLQTTLFPAVAPRYPHMEWAYANGYSKKYASAGWASYDSHFFHWAEDAGYAIDLASQHELHFHPELVEGYSCVVFVGHDEYWTWEMRDTVDDYVDRGGRVARFAGNFMWQTRLENEGKRQVCYKYRARDEDPFYAKGDIRRVTNSWEAREIGRPGARTFGLNATYGLYAGWGGCAPRGARGFPIYRPEHWAFAGTGLYYGDLLGADSHIFGYEVDGLDYVIRHGLPEPTGEGDPPDGLQILGLGLSSLKEERADIPAEGQFLGDEDALFVADVLAGNHGDAAVERYKRGAGMIVNFSRGKGEVFHAGTCEWVAGLLRRDKMVERVTANVLDRYLHR